MHKTDKRSIRTVIAHALAVVMLLGCMTTGIGATFGAGPVKASAEDGVSADNSIEINEVDDDPVEDPVPVWWWYDSVNTTMHLSNSQLETGDYQQAYDAYPVWNVYEDPRYPLPEWVNATKIEIDNTIRPTNTRSWFEGLKNVTRIDGLENLDTSRVRSMEFMFFGCRSLTSLDLSNFNTSKVTAMFHMFDGCSGLISLDLSSFDTSNVTSMFRMFADCDSLTSISFGNNFDTSKVTEMSMMFRDCTSLTELDLSNFDTSTVTGMFCMFEDCTNLTELDVSSFDTSNVTNMFDMFFGCDGLTSLDLSSFDITNVTDMRGMFGSCHNLETIYAKPDTDWSITGASSQYLFYGCQRLKGGNGTEWDINHNDKKYARIDRGEERPGYFSASNKVRVIFDSNGGTRVPFQKIDKGSKATKPDDPTKDGYAFKGWYEDAEGEAATEPFDFENTEIAADITLTAHWINDSIWYWYDDEEKTLHLSGVEKDGYAPTTDSAHGWSSYTYSRSATKIVIDNEIVPGTTSNWFNDFSKVTAIEGLKNLDTSNVTDMNRMFCYCSRLTSLDVSHFDTSRVTDMFGMFGDCSGLTSLDVSSFDTSKVTNMGSMFEHCRSLTSLNLSNFNTSKVTSMPNMFFFCKELESLDVSSFDTSKVTDMAGMFVECHNLTSLDVSHFDTSKVTDMSDMFGYCSGLTSLDVSSFDTSKVTNMEWMFVECNNLETIYAKPDTDWSGTAASSTSMFYNCTALVGGNGTKYAVERVTSGTYARVDGLNGQPGYFTAKGQDPSPTPEPTPSPASFTPSAAPGATAEEAEAAILAMTSDADPAGSMYAPLKAKSTKQTKNSVTLKWSGVGGAVRYAVYGNRSGSAYRMQKLSETAGTSVKLGSIAGATVKKGTYYKFIVVAIDGNNRVVSTSKVVHAASAGGKVGNYKKVTVKKAVTKKAKKLKAGKTLKLKAKAVKKKLKVKKHTKAVRYESSNPAIATVTSSGKVRGVSKGSCVVYAYTQNGVSKAIKIQVK